MRTKWLCTCSVLASAAASAQTCQPYWAQISYESIPPFAARWTVCDDGSGPTLHLASQVQQVLYYRWRNRQWEQLPTAGLPPDRTIAMGLTVQDDGSGPALYTLVRLLSGADQPLRFRNGVWTEMPREFWQFNQSFWHPLVSADMGDGMRIYGKLPGSRIAKWDGAAWQQIGQLGGSSGQLTTYLLLPYDDGNGLALYAFGDFREINGVPALGFAKWDGSAWHGLWPEFVSIPQGSALAVVYDRGDGPAIYTMFRVGIGGEHRRGLHRWDGSAWEFLGGPDTLAPLFIGLSVMEDGAGKSLYITGEFSNFAGLPARSAVRYNADGFSLVPGSGQWRSASGYGPFDHERGESIAVVGDYWQGTSYVPALGLLVGCGIPNCPADCDASGSLNVVDYICFINDYAARRPYANAQPDAVFNIQDFVAFMARYAAGCP